MVDANNKKVIIPKELIFNWEAAWEEHVKLRFELPSEGGFESALEKEYYIARRMFMHGVNSSKQ